MADLYSLFLAACETSASNVAVVYEDGVGAAVRRTYAELHVEASKITEVLRQHLSVFAKGGVIAVDCGNPSASLPSILLAILQMGLTFMPICKTESLLQAVNRVPKLSAVIVRDASAAEADCRYRAALQLAGMTLMVNDVLCAGWRLLTVQPRIPEQHRIIDEMCLRLAYVVTTSGSTGSPKIVFVPHQCIVSNMHALRKIFDLGPGATMYVSSPLTFDAGLVQLFLPLCSGAAALLTDEVSRRTPAAVVGALVRHRVTHLQVVPSYFRYIGSDRLRSCFIASSDGGCTPRVIAFGGERCPSPAEIKALCGGGVAAESCKFYNLYGLTEQSSWSTCAAVDQEWIRSGLDMSVPLGSALLDTDVEVRTDSGVVVRGDGEGQLFLGGDRRTCFIDDAQGAVTYRQWLPTGDVVRVSSADNSVYFVGRMDCDVLKINGIKVNLSTLAMAARQLADVTDACCLYADSVVYVCAESPVAVSPLMEMVERLASQVRSVVGPLLPIPSQPMFVHVTAKFKLNENGKTDRGALLLAAQEENRQMLAERGSNFYSAVAASLPSANDDAAMRDGSHTFVQLGGSSLSAVQLSQTLARAYKLGDASDRLLLDMLLNLPLASVHAWLTAESRGRRPLCSSDRVAELLPSSDPLEQMPQESAKGLAVNPTIVVSPERKRPRSGSLDGDTSEPHEKKLAAQWLQKSSTDQTDHSSCQILRLRLRVEWSVDTGKCVDASPVVCLIRNDTLVAFIGSHSFKFFAIDVQTGAVVWTTVLGGRIEASAAVCDEGRIVAVGCYDGCLYCMCTVTGTILWRFGCNDVIKSTPAVDDAGRCLYFGSHDKNVYAVDVKLQQCLWSTAMDGAVFASPLLHGSNIYTAALSGTVSALDKDSGIVKWRTGLLKPIFASPRHSSSLALIYVCCVDQRVYALQEDTGILMWNVDLGGAVFASPQIFFDEEHGNDELVIVGCRASPEQRPAALFCLKACDGTVIWRCETNVHVSSASSPAFDAGLPRCTCDSRSLRLIACCHVDGTVQLLDVRSGEPVGSYTLPGEVFSSPLVLNGRKILVGCRDDRVYCLQVERVPP